MQGALACGEVGHRGLAGAGTSRHGSSLAPPSPGRTPSQTADVRIHLRKGANLTADVTAGDPLTADDLIATAIEAGLGASHRLIRDWSQWGLLDRPSRRGLGRGRGTSRGTWPAPQRDLFLALLRFREAGGSVAECCTWPVWAWLWHGDEVVSLRQVRAALKTWGAAVTDPAWARAEAGARQVADVLATPGVPRRVKKRLRSEIEQQATDGFDPGRLREAARDVIDAGSGPRGPVGAQVDASRYVKQVALRLRGRENLDSWTDDEFAAARELYRVTKSGYAREQPRFAADPDLGRLFERATADNDRASACADLALALGALEEWTSKGQPKAR